MAPCTSALARSKRTCSSAVIELRARAVDRRHLATICALRRRTGNASEFGTMTDFDGTRLGHDVVDLAHGMDVPQTALLR